MRRREEDDDDEEEEEEEEEEEKDSGGKGMIVLCGLSMCEALHVQEVPNHIDICRGGERRSSEWRAASKYRQVKVSHERGCERVGDRFGTRARQPYCPGRGCGCGYEMGMGMMGIGLDMDRMDLEYGDGWSQAKSSGVIGQLREQPGPGDRRMKRVI
jgi:hypothetical protein